MKIIYLKRPGWWLAAALAVTLVLCLALALWIVPAAPTTAGAGQSLLDKVVLIDPGHGGFDPGAVADDGSHEDELNLAISLYLAQSLRDRGATVIMTRMGDGALAGTKREDMARRLELIKGCGADMVISIHMNDFVVERYHGAQVFYRRGDEKSKRLAALIQDTLRSQVDPDNTRQCKYADDFGVLNIASVPAVLVECGFLSNHEETKKLAKPAYQARMAAAIAEAAAVFFQEE